MRNLAFRDGRYVELYMLCYGLVVFVGYPKGGSVVLCDVHRALCEVVIWFACMDII